VVSSTAAALSKPRRTSGRGYLLNIASDHRSLHLITRPVRPRGVGLVVPYPCQIAHIDDATACFTADEVIGFAHDGRSLDAAPDDGAARKLWPVNHGMSLSFRGRQTFAALGSVDSVQSSGRPIGKRRTIQCIAAGATSAGRSRSRPRRCGIRRLGLDR
jgi:hypothetical protein